MKISSVALEETNIGAHAILVDFEGKLILQNRENKPKIDNPGMITMFGGTVNKSETVEEGLKRELKEELEFYPVDGNIKYLNTYSKTKEKDGIEYSINVFIVRNVNIKNLRLKEGAGFVHDFPDNVLNNPKLTRICRLAVQDFLIKTN